MKSKTVPLVVVLAVCVAALMYVKIKTGTDGLAARLVSVDNDTRNMALARIPKLDEAQRAKVAADILAAPLPRDPSVKRFSMYALRKLGPQTTKSIDYSLRLLSDADAQVREEAANSLMEAGEPALDGVMDALIGKEPNARAEAVRITAKVGPPAVVALTKAFEKSSGEGKVSAALALCALQSTVPAAVPVLAEALGKSPWGQRSVEIAMALEKMGVAAKEAEPTLTKLLVSSQDSYSDPSAARPVLARTLQRISPRRSQLVDYGFDLKQKDPAIRYRAAYGLSEANPPQVGAVSMLVDALNDKDVYVAARALVGLGRIGFEKTERLKKIAYPRMKSALERGRTAKIQGFVELVEPSLNKVLKKKA